MPMSRDDRPHGSTTPTRVAVVGASGYTGAELLRLLLSHPHVEITAACAGRRAGEPLTRVFPQFRGRLELSLEAFDPDRIAEAADVAFTALPHGDSARAVAALRARGLAVLDLSADFRLRDPAEYATWYGNGAEHPEPAALREAAYGLPELHRETIRGAKLVACPGCYPTSAILPLAPLLRAGLVEPTGIAIDSKSGVSGAGRGASLSSHFPEIGEGIRPYKVAGSHRHTPEIEQELGRVAGADVRVSFTPHLVPMSRGILTVAYARPTDAARDEAAYLEALREAYADEPFVAVLDDGALPDTAHLRGSNRAHVAVRLDRRANLVLAMAALDNLVKGAAGQAVQCLNLMRGWDEPTGLDHVAAFP